VTRTARVVFASFFLSGATSLVYQVVWARALALIFGHSMYAIAAVLVAFMAGSPWAAPSSRAAPRASGTRCARTGCWRSASRVLRLRPLPALHGGQTYFGIQRALDCRTKA